MSINSQYIIEHLPDTANEFIEILQDKWNYNTDNNNLMNELQRLMSGTRHFQVSYSKGYRKRNFPVFTVDIYNLVRLYTLATGSIVFLHVTDFIENYPNVYEYNNEKDLRLQIVRIDKTNLPDTTNETEKVLSNYFSNIVKDEEIKVVYKNLEVNNEECIPTLYATKLTQELITEFVKLIPKYTRCIRYEELYNTVKALFINKDEYKEHFIEFLRKYFNPENQLIDALRQKKERELSTITRRIESVESDIQSALNTILSYQERLNELTDRKRGIQMIINDPIDLTVYKEALTYLTNSFKTITSAKLTVPSETLCFDVTGTAVLQYFDTEAAQRIYNRYEEELQREGYSSMSRTKADLFKALFVDQTLKVNTSYHYSLDTESFRASTGTKESILNAIIHPHLMRYSCWGNHSAALTKYMVQEDYIGALTHCQYATIQLNVLDSCVLNWLLDTIINSEIKCLLNEDNEFISWKEYYDAITTDNGTDTN